MRRSLQFTLVVALVASHGACGRSGQPGERGFTPAPSTPSTPGVVPRGATPTVAEHMKDHFTQASRAREAIIRGELTAAKEPARWLADHEVSETLPDAWQPHVGDMQNAARLALQADDLAVAADALGAMGAACGGCHTALGAAVQFTGMSPEGQESSVQGRMARHAWAAERMWEGLIGPSDVAWQAGIAALQEAPLHPEMLADDRSPPAEVVALATEIHALAWRGSMMKEPQARARLYGEYLATCAGCHSRLGVQFMPRT